MTVRPFALPAALAGALALGGCAASSPAGGGAIPVPIEPAAADMGPAPEMTEALPPPADEAMMRYAATITPAELAGHLYVYADDFMAGRDTGDPGQRFASKWIAGQYQAMGVAPKGTGEASNYGIGGFLQPFELERRTLTSMRFTATRDGAEILTAALPSDGMAPLVPAFGMVPAVTDAPVLFAGTGEGLDSLDVDGAFVIVMAPDQGSMQRAAQAAMGAGAAGVLLPAAPTAAPFQGMVARALAGGRLSMSSEDGGAGVLLMGMDTAATLLGGPLGEAAVGDTGARMTTTVDGGREAVPTENVVAVVEGSDPELKDEYVIISAHLDHIGVGSGEAEGDVIFNGADDDGSGTVALLEIAEAFQAAADAGEGPRRSVMFLHVTGEEKGLFGSAYYADREPIVPLASTVANLNIDMIGRYDPERGFETTDYVYIIGGDLISQDLHDWNETVNATAGLDLLLSDRFNSPDDPNQFFRRSDHWNFGKHDIPFIFYFTGTHEDYHGVGDEAHKIDYDRMATISRLIFGTAWEVANRDERPAVSGVGFN